MSEGRVWFARFNRWRVLFPSWRFFDRAGAETRLWYRVESHGWSDWKPALDEPQMKWWGIFLNPDINKFHALQNLVERLLQESQTLENAEDVSQLTSYQLLKRHVALLADENRSFQMKITVDGEEVLLSTEERVA